MSETNALTERVDEVASGPAAATIDGNSVQQHDLRTLDEIATRRQADRAVKKAHRGLRFNKIVPPGAG